MCTVIGKTFFFKCACLGDSKYHNLHLKSRFPAIHSIQSYKIFCSSGLIIGTLQVMLKRVNFYHIVFHDLTWKN